MGGCFSDDTKDAVEEELGEGKNDVIHTREIKMYVNEDDERMMNNYQILHTIGKGSFAKVLLICNDEGHSFACKKMNKRKLKKEKKPSGRSVYEDCLNEIEILKILKGHKNVIEIFEVIDDPKHDFLNIIVEYCQKGVLMDTEKELKSKKEKAEEFNEKNVVEVEDLIDKSNPKVLILSPQKSHVPKKTDANVRDIKMKIKGIVEGLEYIHSKKIYHGDIKPDNVLIDYDNVVKLTDFGTSKLLKSKDDRIRSDDGTPTFLNPEALHNEEYSPFKRDVWALGVTLYVLLFKELPFKGKTLKELKEIVRNGELKFPSEIDDELKDLLKRMLDKNENTRISITEIKKHNWLVNS